MDTTSPQVVKPLPTDDRGIGDNGGPPLQKFTAKQKVERIKEVLEMDVTAAQKCVGIGIICEADTDWITPELSTERLRQFANVKDRETVYKATKTLTSRQVVSPQKVEGKANRYIVLPPTVVDAIVGAYNQHKTSQVGPDGLPDAVAVGSNPTRPIEPVGSEPTGAVSTDALRAPAPARIEPPSGVNISKQKQQPTTTVESEAEGGGGIDFDVLNGTAVDIAAFISKHARVDTQTAERMLTNNIKAFTADAMLEAYSVTTAEMASGLVSAPYKYLIGVAKGVKDRAQRSGGKGRAATTTPDDSAAKKAWQRRVIEDALRGNGK